MSNISAAISLKISLSDSEQDFKKLKAKVLISSNWTISVCELLQIIS